MTRESLVCPGCSCLCDDLDVTLENGRITEVANVCLWGAGKFLSTKKFRTKSPRGRLTAFQVRRRGAGRRACRSLAWSYCRQVCLHRLDSPR